MISPVLLEDLANLTLNDFESGQIILLDKPLTWTSFDVVNRIRVALCRHFKIKKLKVGHAGTLDPLATGLLILCTGRYTKQIDTLQAMTKTYSGSFTLGATTPSYDLETDVDQWFSTDHINNELVHEVSQNFLGNINQLPPIYSAIKKDGKRLYEIARSGNNTEINPRAIEILDFDVSLDKDKVFFKVVCSKGTYIRSLAHDFGKALNSGAYLSSLVRNQIGDYSLNQALSMEQFLASFKRSIIKPNLV